MDPFQSFLELKTKIYHHEEFMDSLMTYVFTDRLLLPETQKVTHLGAGRNNIHFRIGKVDTIWLATREYVNAIEIADHMQHCENYIAAAVRNYQKGKRVPLVCGAVKAISRNRERYFLLLEDLTHGGTADFQPAPRSGGVSGVLHGVNVFYDFDTDEPFHPPLHYLAEDKILTLKR
ncbi:MAG: hypothetical protein Q7K45_04030 [Nanoarchaeota archaeon]|nr:hypothetical protein [Nanoarchaeota archaeon]